MIDIEIKGGKAFAVDTVVFKAANLLKVQEGELEYHPNFGIDLKRFFDPDIQIQNETFEAYSLQKMAQNGINPISLAIEKKTFEQIFNYDLISAETGGFIR